MAISHQEVVTLNHLSDQTEQTEGEFAHFFAQSLDLLCIAGFDGYFKRLNPAWTKQLGWTREALAARPFLDFVHPDDREATLVEMGALSEGADTILFENRYRHRDGSYRWLRWNARPVPGGERIYAIARDVTREKRLEREILEIVDREKEHFGRELHDGLCQNLSGIAALSSALSKRLEADSESISAAAAEITQLLNETIREARDLSRGLGPIGLRETGLQVALETLAVNTEQRFRVSCRLESDCPCLRLGQEVQVQLFRIAQEAVNNALTHGKAGHIDIRLTTKFGAGFISVRDDGVGLPLDRPKVDGIGLQTMVYRARLIGGLLKVRRRNQRGTAVTCAFPLREKARTSENQYRVRGT